MNIKITLKNTKFDIDITCKLIGLTKTHVKFQING